MPEFAWAESHTYGLSRAQKAAVLEISLGDFQNPVGAYLRLAVAGNLVREAAPKVKQQECRSLLGQSHIHKSSFITEGRSTAIGRGGERVEGGGDLGGKAGGGREMAMRRRRRRGDGEVRGRRRRKCRRRR